MQDDQSNQRSKIRIISLIEKVHGHGRTTNASISKRLKNFLPVIILLLALVGCGDLVVELLILAPSAFVLILVLFFLLEKCSCFKYLE